MWGEILTAIALVFVIEGLLPALAPSQYRSVLMRLVSQTDKRIRVFGFASLLLGAVIMVCTHWLWLL